MCFTTHLKLFYLLFCIEYKCFIVWLTNSLLSDFNFKYSTFNSAGRISTVEIKQDFTNDDKKYIFRQVSEFIMRHNSKNGDIGRLQCEYESIFRAVNEK